MASLYFGVFGETWNFQASLKPGWLTPSINFLTSFPYYITFVVSVISAYEPQALGRVCFGLVVISVRQGLAREHGPEPSLGVIDIHLASG